jgi:hypothetical protein
MFSMVQVNRIYLIFNPVHFLVDSSELKKQNKTLIKVYAINKEDALQRIFRQYQKS